MREIFYKKNKGSVNEDKWITIKGRHTLVDNDGNIKDDKFKKQIDTNKSKSSVKKSMKDTIKSLGMDPENAGANYSDIEDLDYSRYVSDHIMDIKKEFGVEDADKEFEELADLQYDLKDSLHLRINSKWNNKPGAKERFDGEMSEYKKRIKDIKNNLMSKGLNEKDCDELLDYSGLNIVKIDRFIKKFIKFN